MNMQMAEKDWPNRDLTVQVATPDRIVPHWSIPTGAAARTSTVAASADAAFVAEFDTRVRRLFALLNGALANGPPTPDAIVALRGALHQVAGTAAFFGKAALGSAAAEIDDQLRDHARATLLFLHDARAMLRQLDSGGQ